MFDNQTRPRAGAEDLRVNGDRALLEFGVGAFEGEVQKVDDMRLSSGARSREGGIKSGTI
jgi:hypothetical protein